MAQQQLFEAVQALYQHPDEKVKKQANDWLEAWQQASESWQVSTAVLETSAGSTEAQYFCAVTLRTKVIFAPCLVFPSRCLPGLHYV